MAERRMFAKAVIGSGKFLRMPATARLLYYDLGMEADDDGVVEAFRVIRTTGASEDDLKILMARGLVRVLNDELVTLITDWKVNNYIQRDRYHPSLYAALINTDGVDTTCIQPVYNMDTSGIPTVSNPDTEVRLGEDRVRSGQYSVGESNGAAPAADTPARTKPQKKQFVPPTVEEVRAYCDEQGIAVDAERFIDYYAANGWKVGNQAMKDWRATVRNWARRDRERGYTDKPKETRGAANKGFSEPSFDTDDFFDAALQRTYGDNWKFFKEGMDG
jgi:hypothetical protein